MSDLPPVEPDAGPVETEASSSPAGFGYALAQSRVRAGLSVEQAAGRMRLSAKQLRALEAEDLEALPAAAFVNGFVRNYARELGMDPKPLIEDLNAKLKLRGLIDDPPDLGPGGAAQGRILDDRGWRHLVLAGIVAGLVCAGLIGVWMARPANQTRGQSAAAPQGMPGPSRMQTPVAAAPSAAAPSGPAPVNAAPQDVAGRGSETAAAATVVATAPTPPSEGAHAPIVVATPATASSSSGATEGAPPAAASSDGPPAGLVLRFSDRSWVQVSRPDGRVLLSRNDEAGSMELLNPSTPLVLIIGRADAVRVEYRGQPVDLKPYSNSQGVARLTLGDAHASSGGQNSR